MTKKIDKLSKWLKETVQQGSRAAEVSGKQDFRKHKKNKGQGAPHKKPGRPSEKVVHGGVMRVIPIGGLEEVGKNAMIVEHEKDIVVIDIGFQFPEDEMFGVDYVIPDIQYLVERKNRVRGILITHGHLDHIGALPYVLPDLGFPTIYASKLTIGLIKKQLEEHDLVKSVKFVEINNKDTYNFGSLSASFFRVNHSIPDAYGVHLRSPNGTMVHTGDFKFDFTPADGIESDIGKMSRLGKSGVNIMFSDSTNALKPGHTLSEKVVGENLNRAIEGASGRIIIACFSSLIGRIQQIFEFAQASNRKVFLSGRSIINNVRIAQELGFLRPASGVIVDMTKVKNYPPEQVLILTTGSQGEPMAALSRMASNSHSHVRIQSGDTVVVSASPIIGNEKSVAFLVDALSRLGAEVVHNRIMDIHTSGHGHQEDLKMMMSLVRPDHLVPVHGNHYMRHAHGLLAPQVGIPASNVHLMDNGNVIELRKGKVSFKDEDIKVRYIVIDGLGMGDLASKVMKDREAMAQNGIVHIILKMRKGRLVGAPIVSTHGFVYQKELEKMEAEIVKEAKDAVAKLSKKSAKVNSHDFENYVRSAVSGFIMKRIDRRPLVAPMVLHV